MYVAEGMYVAVVNLHVYSLQINRRKNGAGTRTMNMERCNVFLEKSG